MNGSKILFAHRKRLINIRLENSALSQGRAIFIGGRNYILRKGRIPHSGKCALFIILQPEQRQSIEAMPTSPPGGAYGHRRKAAYLLFSFFRKKTLLYGIS